MIIHMRCWVGCIKNQNNRRLPTNADITVVGFRTSIQKRQTYRAMKHHIAQGLELDRPSMSMVHELEYHAVLI